MNRLLIIYCFFIAAVFSTKFCYPQKAKNLVVNGDLEVFPDTIFFLEDSTRFNAYSPSILNGFLVSYFLSSNNFPKNWLYAINSDATIGLGNLFNSPYPQNWNKYDSILQDYPRKRTGRKAVKFFTGKPYFLKPGPPSISWYGPWGGSSASFLLYDTIIAGEKLYVEWMDLRLDMKNQGPVYNIYGATSNYTDSIPDSIQIGLSNRKDSIGLILNKSIPRLSTWAKHSLIFNNIVDAYYITVGNKGDTNHLSFPPPFSPPLVGSKYTSANYIDNLRMFRVSGSSSRDTVLCGPSSFVLPGAAGKEWEWNDSVTTQNFVVNLGDSGWYVCKTFTDGFVRFDSIYVRFDEALSVQPAVDTVGCTGQVLVLPSPRVGGYSYVWSNNSTTQNIVTTAAGSFWVASKKGSCTVVDTFHVVFAPKPVVYLGADTAFCGSFVHLLQAGAGKKDYTWNTGDKSSTLLVNSAGQYSVTVRDSLNCPNADTIHLEQITLNDIQLTEDTLTCKYVTLTGAPLQNNVAYVWSNGTAGISTQVTQTGTYTLTASHPFCSLSKSVQVTQLPIPPQVNLGSDTTLCGYGRVVLENKNAGLPHYVYQWSNGSSAPRITVHDSGLYYLVVYRNQCTGSDSVLVAPDCEGTFYIPSAFSPNGDNLNDVFGVTGSNIISVHLRIYNRWGEELYNRKGSAESVFWNGLYKNETCIAGEYIYTVTVEVLHSDKRMQHKSGTVHLMR